MKVLELLTLVYEKKAPKRILYKYCEYEFNSVTNEYENADGKQLFSYLFKNEVQPLSLEVEIIGEKNKRIKKLAISNYNHNFNQFQLDVIATINRLIDKVDYLPEKGDE